jgi:two-component system, LytTR family, response regulator
MGRACIIIEDNLIERDALALKLKKMEGLDLKASFADGLEALSYLKNNKVELIFSDIDMPDLSGIELLKSLKQPPAFIFISSHSEHAAESFNLDVIDFIVKPVKIERLIKAVDKAFAILEQNQSNTTEIESAPKEAEMDFFFIKENNIHIKVNVDDVLYIESMGDFSKIIVKDNKSHMVLISLKNLEKQLSPLKFMRVHKQFMVNLAHIVSIANTDLKLSNQQLIPVSTSQKQILMDEFINKRTLSRFKE